MATDDKNGGNGNGNGGPKKSAEQLREEQIEKNRTAPIADVKQAEDETRAVKDSGVDLSKLKSQLRPPGLKSESSQQETITSSSQDDSVVHVVWFKRPLPWVRDRIAWVNDHWLWSLSAVVALIIFIFLFICAGKDEANEMSVAATAQHTIPAPASPPPQANEPVATEVRGEPKGSFDDVAVSPPGTEAQNESPQPIATETPEVPAHTVPVANHIAPPRASPPPAKPTVNKLPRAMPAVVAKDHFGKKAFMKGLKDPSELAARIEASFETDPSGHTMLSATRCKQDGSCASPIDYLDTLQVYDPDANLKSVADLPGYFRSLVIGKAPSGKYYMACVMLDASGARGAADCMARVFDSGEHGWVNPKTGRVVLAENCTNPVGKLYPHKTLVAPPPPACYLIPLDYTHTKGVEWDEKHRAKVSVHIDVPDTTLRQMYDDECFGVVDSSSGPHPRKPYRECAFCYDGVYPPEELARAVKLPEEEPKGSLSIEVADGKGYFSVAKKDAAHGYIFCVLVEGYPIIVIEGYEDTEALTRFDYVTKDEVERTLPQGRLDRTLSGSQHY